MIISKFTKCCHCHHNLVFITLVDSWNMIAIRHLILVNRLDVPCPVQRVKWFAQGRVCKQLSRNRLKQLQRKKVALWFLTLLSIALQIGLIYTQKFLLKQVLSRFLISLAWLGKPAFAISRPVTAVGSSHPSLGPPPPSCLGWSLKSDMVIAFLFQILQRVCTFCSRGLIYSPHPHARAPTVLRDLGAIFLGKLALIPAPLHVVKNALLNTLHSFLSRIVLTTLCRNDDSATT